MAGFPGFDSSAFPGLEAMGWLRANTNLHWCGFYLGPAPSHDDRHWMPHRAALNSQGWGLAPIYVGQQVTGPGSKSSSAPQGEIDAGDAVRLMSSAGFPAGSYVYLDLENGKPLQAVQRSYVAAWVDGVANAGFGAGVYCSHTFALDIHVLCPAARIWAFKVPTTKKHTVPGHNFPDPHPSGSGFPGSFMWQLDQNAIIEASSATRLTVDLDTSLTPDPGR